MTAISGSRVTLKRARSIDRARVYEWLIGSDLTANMMGGMMFPDHPIPSLEAFTADYPELFFDGSRPYAGRMLLITVGNDEIGCISHGAIDLRNDVVVVNLVLSVDQDRSPEIAAMIGTSIAVATSDIPWNGPIGGWKCLRRHVETWRCACAKRAPSCAFCGCRSPY